jgi:hypothetical protein
MFAGTITLDSNAITGRTTLGSVKQRPGATTPFGPGSAVFVRGSDLQVFAQGDNDAATIELIEISFWLSTKKKK